MPTVAPEHAQRVAAAVLGAFGTPAPTAEKIAAHLVSADRAGHPSHGIIRLIDYAKRIRTGDLVPTASPSIARGVHGGPIVLVDGGAGYGQLAAERLVDELVDRVRDNGIAAGGIVNASHTGRLGEWSERAIDRGVILFLASASLARGNVAAYGAREPRLGTNPMTVGVPAGGGDRFVLDYATSAISGGRIDYLVSAGLEAPPGALLDADGNSTVDPNAWRDGGMLLPFGGHKGYGLSLLIALLAGCVVGSAAPDNPRHGVFAFAVSPGVFADEATVLAAIAHQLDRMRDTPAAPGFDAVEVPGDYERRNREGPLAVADGAWDEIVALAAANGVPG